MLPFDKNSVEENVGRMVGGFIDDPFIACFCFKKWPSFLC